jgi:protein-tyrosine-phosphatase
MSVDAPVVLFVCVHNAGRSQMAAALTALLSGGRVDVRSAGSAPAEIVHPNVVEVMREVGVDLSGAKPKALQDSAVETADVVVTMGRGDACPVYPGKRYLDWDVADPAGKTAEEVRTILDEIAERVRGLLDDLGASATNGDDAPADR